jgi:hypothetical protein
VDVLEHTYNHSNKEDWGRRILVPQTKTQDPPWKVTKGKRAGGMA